MSACGLFLHDLYAAVLFIEFTPSTQVLTDVIVNDWGKIKFLTNTFTIDELTLFGSRNDTISAIKVK